MKISKICMFHKPTIPHKPFILWMHIVWACVYVQQYMVYECGVYNFKKILNMPEQQYSNRVKFHYLCRTCHNVRAKLISVELKLSNVIKTQNKPQNSYLYQKARISLYILYGMRLFHIRKKKKQKKKF